MNPSQNGPAAHYQPLGYNVHTGADVQAMLAVLGLESVAQLFAAVPQALRLRRDLDLPPPLSEWELLRDARALAALNATALTHGNYLGGGAYEHYIPAVVDAIAARGEFLTAYTPYQPEMSQGLLQALYEFQLLAARLLGLPCVNCTVYDGATALAEACLMMCRARGLRRVLVAQALWPQYRQVLDSYLLARTITIEPLAQDAQTGRIDPAALAALLASGGVAGVVLQSPNALGVIEDVQAAAAQCRDGGGGGSDGGGALLAVCVNPLLCGWLEPPGALGADIAVCEGQPLGLPLSAGGPYAGIIACSKALERELPGRLVGRVHDLEGRPGYALVKEDREQHVARDQATSHICSNQALNAIRIAVHLCCLGEANFMRIAQANAANALALRTRLTALPGVALLRSGVHFNEFALALPLDAAAFCARMRACGIFAGVPIEPALAGHDRGLLVAVTETKSGADLEHYALHARACLLQG